ncbi:MAG: hypothetical protein MJ241_06170, partial [Bacilli bacterium]|nr:hypothetical protein [Bacilli bacterium]
VTKKDLTYTSSDSTIVSLNVNKVTGEVTANGNKAGTAVITCKDNVSGVTGTITITVEASAALIPSTLAGTWTGTDDTMYCDTVITVNSDGTGTLVIDDLGVSITFTFKSASGKVYTFECSTGKTLVLEIGSSHLFVTYDGGEMDGELNYSFDDATFDR